MKKLYRRGMVHPSPPVISDHLAFLPATILTLAAALSPEDREVLAYLVSCSSGNRRNTQKASAAAVLGSGKGGDHPPSFNCDCFRCYTSYWVRWDSSPSRQLIHEIIDAFEDGLLAQSKKLDKNNKRKKKKDESTRSELTRSELSSNKGELGDSKSVEEASLGGGGSGGGGAGEDSGGVGSGAGDEGGETEKGSVRKFVSFLGEKFWSVWN